MTYTIHNTNNEQVGQSNNVGEARTIAKTFAALHKPQVFIIKLDGTPTHQAQWCNDCRKALLRAI